MKIIRAFCVALGLVCTQHAAVAQQPYPNRPIRVISPYPAGSASDTVTRVVMEQVSQLIGQPVVIEMKPGAGGSIGFSSVARSDPDGYTVATSSSWSFAKALTRRAAAPGSSCEKASTSGPLRTLPMFSNAVPAR